MPLIIPWEQIAGTSMGMDDWRNVFQLRIWPPFELLKLVRLCNTGGRFSSGRRADIFWRWAYREVLKRLYLKNTGPASSYNRMARRMLGCEICAISNLVSGFTFSKDHCTTQDREDIDKLDSSILPEDLKMGRRPSASRLLPP